jgi:hypothetical protein
MFLHFIGRCNHRATRRLITFGAKFSALTVPSLRLQFLRRLAFAALCIRTVYVARLHCGMQHQMRLLMTNSSRLKSPDSIEDSRSRPNWRLINPICGSNGNRRKHRTTFHFKGNLEDPSTHLSETAIDTSNARKNLRRRLGCSLKFASFFGISSSAAGLHRVCSNFPGSALGISMKTRMSVQGLLATFA